MWRRKEEARGKQGLREEGSRPKVALRLRGEQKRLTVRGISLCQPPVPPLSFDLDSLFDKQQKLAHQPLELREISARIVVSNNQVVQAFHLSHPGTRVHAQVVDGSPQTVGLAWGVYCF